MWIDELERSAAERLEWYVMEYFRATAGDAARARAAAEEWAALSLRPRVLQGARTLSPATTVLGTPVSTPVLVAPMAQQVAADPRGERATAEAAARIGTLLGVSTNTGVPFADVAAQGAPWWFQLYLLGRRSITERFVARAVEAGASAIVLTVDTTALTVSRPGVEPTEWPDAPGKARLVNLTARERDELVSVPASPNPALEDIAWLKELSGLPVVVKGVLRADDADRAVGAGADGIIVSTHGGRRIGSSVSSLRALAEIAPVVGGRAELFVDSGIRSGVAVLAALALGARAVFVGRPVMWGLATGGADGVAAVVQRLTSEFAIALDQSGVTSLDALTPDLVVLPG